MTQTDPLDLDVRRRLWRLVRDRPGLYLRQLQREAGLAMGSLEYHLGRLQRTGLIRAAADDGHKRFFPHEMNPQDQRVMSFLRQGLPRRILVALLAENQRPKSDLRQELAVARTTLDYHIDRLAAATLLTIDRQGTQAVVSVLDAPRIERMLITYRASFFDRVVDRFLSGVDQLRLGQP